jgi:hypothetical protein
MTGVKVKRGPGRPKGSKNKVNTTKVVAVKRGRGRPKGSKNKPKTTDIKVVSRGRGRPKGSTNKEKVDVEFYKLPHPDPNHEWERIDNIRHMVSFYQNPDGTKKFGASGPKKRGRKSAVEELDIEKLLKQDLDSDHVGKYGEDDVKDELEQQSAYQDFKANRDRYS